MGDSCCPSQFQALSSWGRDEGTREVKKNERGLGRVVALPYHPNLLSTFADAHHNFARPHLTESLELANHYQTSIEAFWAFAKTESLR